jgi:hypothetical protein
MEERSRERKKSAGKIDGEAEVRAKIAELSQPDRAMAERVHEIVTSAVPELTARTWYGMAAYAKDGDAVCFFPERGQVQDPLRHHRLLRQGRPRRGRPVAGVLRPRGADAGGGAADPPAGGEGRRAGELTAVRIGKQA